MERTEYFVSLQSSVVITEEYNVTAKSEELDLFQITTLMHDSFIL